MSEPSGQGKQSGQGRAGGAQDQQRAGGAQDQRRAGGARDQQRAGGPGEMWERRAADLASELQRRLIRSSARNMRDELGDQVKKAFRGSDGDRSDVWATATTEPPDAASQPPECAWCPICRAARRMAQAQSQGGSAAAAPSDAAPKGAGPGLAGAADVIVGAARDALSGLDAILSYRPPDANGSARGQHDADSEKEPDHEPDHRG